MKRLARILAAWTMLHAAAAGGMEPNLSQYLEKAGGKYILRVPPDTVWFPFVDPGSGDLRLSMFNLAISAKKRLSVFERVWETIRREYYDPLLRNTDWEGIREAYRPLILTAGNKVDLAKVLDQMIHEIHGSHLQVKVYLLPKDRNAEKIIERKWQEERERYRSGIGFNLKRIENQWVVGSVDPGSDADRKGVLRGWIVRYVQDRFFDPKTLRLESIKPGDVFPFSFIDLEGRPRNVRVAAMLYPEPAEPPAGGVKILRGGFVCIVVREFRRKMDRWFIKTVQAYADAPGMVLDLRGNTGGYMPIVTRCLAPFFEGATAAGTELSRKRKPRILVSEGMGGRAYRGPLAILIDEDSISGAEIFAAVMQENGRAKIVGRHSAGEVLGSVTLEMPEWYTLRLPIYEYRTAEGRILEGQGVKPDAEVALTLGGFRRHYDADMERALALIEAIRAGVCERNPH